MEQQSNEQVLAVLQAVEPLKLDTLDHDWVSSIFSAEFLDAGELPCEYEAALGTEEVYKVLRAAGKALNSWRVERSWASLSRALPYEPLLALLFYLIDHGNRNISTKEYRDNAVLAAQLYCKLLAVPGFKAYNVYHAQLFVSCTSCLGYPKSLCESDESRLSPRERAREVNAYNTRLCAFLKDFKVVVNLLELKPEQIAFEEILNHLIDLTGMTVTSKLDLDHLELNIISQLSYDIIHALLTGSDNEPRPSCIQALFKCLLPKLLATSLDCRTSATVARASHVTYCAVILARYGKAALCGYSILLQHLCFAPEGMERLEVRTARVPLVVGLMSLLPKKAFRKFLDWVLLLSTTAKAPHRLLALEIFAKLLNTNIDEPESEAPSRAEPAPGPSSQTDDPSGEVLRTDRRHLQESDLGLLTYKAGEEQLTSDILRKNVINATSTITTNSSAQNTIKSDLMTEDSQSSQESQESEPLEDDGVPVISAQTHSVPFQMILQAVYERANDVSSTVRVRALAILMNCITSDLPALVRAVKKMNGDAERPLLISLAVRYMGDERAVVRKSAITLVDVQLRRDQTLLTKNNLGVLVSLCRDTSVLVRSAAVATLGELVVRWPRDCTLDAFLAGPMRQLKDPEVKVQDQIQTIVRTVLFSKLAPRSDPPAEHQQLPWLFLSAVARHNMRRHLEKVCGMLAKSAKCVNHRVIDIISTYIGTDAENDLNCLVLLSSVARHVQYSNVEFLLNYYYQLSLDLQSRDARLLPLLLEVLTDWSRYFAPQQRSELRSHLIESLHTGSCGSEGSRRSCVLLAAHLDPGDIGWASEFLLACEQRALDGAPVSEWLCAADMTLVAPEQPSPPFVQLFVSTAAELHKSHPQTDLSESAQGCLVAGLGRICIRSRAVAVVAAPTFANLLVAQHAPICVRVNALLALSDMCKRYTGIVEPLMNNICSCLEASPTPLRRAAVRTITRLLLNDFLRLRAPLYYRYCALLADGDTEVREPVEYYVTSVLNSDVIYHHFVECLMYYNGCSAHSNQTAARTQVESLLQDTTSQEESPLQESGKDSQDLCIELQSSANFDGEGMRFDSRQQIYDLMLQRMTPGQRLNVQVRLATEVLVQAAVLSDEEEPLTLALRSAIVDTVAVLRGPHMRLPRKPQQQQDTAMNVEDLTARVTSNVMSHKMKKTVAEVVVPAVIRLYSRLSAGGGGRGTAAYSAANLTAGTATAAGAGAGASDAGLATCLVSLASDLLNDYKAEIEELIDNDPELVEQISLFQEKIGEEPSFRSRHNIVIRDVPELEATPCMRAPRKRPLRSHAQPPTKRVLRL